MTSLSNVHWRHNSQYPDSRESGYSKHGYTGNHVDPTEYTGFGGRVTGGLGYTKDMLDIPNASMLYDFESRVLYDHVMNKAWSQLVSKIHSSSAQLGAALGEAGEAFEMIALRGGSLYRAYRDLRHGRFRRFLADLGLSPKRKHRNLVNNSLSQVSNLWLEYHYGWSPLCSDVYDACHALTRPLPGGYCQGVGYAHRSYKAGSSNVYTYEADIFGKQAGNFYVDSPNLYLLTSAGLINPVSVAWELVPFSFVADWFGNVGQVISGWSDLLGLKILRPYRTYFAKGTGDNYYTWSPNFVTYEGWYCYRHPGLQKPVLEFNFLHPARDSWSLAATAWSLLTAVL